MKSQVLGETAGEIWYWSLLGMKGLNTVFGLCQKTNSSVSLPFAGGSNILYKLEGETGCSLSTDRAVTCEMAVLPRLCWPAIRHCFSYRSMRDWRGVSRKLSSTPSWTERKRKAWSPVTPRQKDTPDKRTPSAQTISHITFEIPFIGHTWVGRNSHPLAVHPEIASWPLLWPDSPHSSIQEDYVRLTQTTIRSDNVQLVDSEVHIHWEQLPQTNEHFVYANSWLYRSQVTSTHVRETREK